MARNPNLSYIFKLCREDRENSVHISALAQLNKNRDCLFLSLSRKCTIFSKVSHKNFMKFGKENFKHKEVVYCKKIEFQRRNLKRLGL